jgi:low affinity Fe/Cu permease
MNCWHGAVALTRRSGAAVRTTDVRRADHTTAADLPDRAATPSVFSRFTRSVAVAAGRPIAFMLALAFIVCWALTGPVFNFSPTWQLVINTGTTIVTFLMIFLVQDTQNRDATAMQLKLDELIRVLDAADNRLLDIEQSDHTDQEKTRVVYEELAKAAVNGDTNGGEKPAS